MATVQIPGLEEGVQSRGLELGDLWGPFQLKPSWDSVINLCVQYTATEHCTNTPVTDKNAAFDLPKIIQSTQFVFEIRIHG